MDIRIGFRKTQELAETSSFLLRFLPSFQMPGSVYTENSREFITACHDLQRTHDAIAPHHSETNVIAAARFPDTIYRSPSMCAKANHRLSVHTHVHLSEAPILLRLPENESPHVRRRLPPSRRPKRWDAIEEPVVRHERNQKRCRTGGIAVGKKDRSPTQWGKGANVGVSLRSPKINCSWSHKLVGIQMVGEKNIGTNVENSANRH